MAGDLEDGWYVDKYPSSITDQIMRNALKKVSFDFYDSRFKLEIPDSSWRISKVEGTTLGFYSHIFRYRFHLPLHLFCREDLARYNLVLSQFTTNSWARIIGYLVECQKQNWDPFVNILIALYRLTRERGWFYLLNRVPNASPITSNTHSNSNQFFLISLAEGYQWPFKVDWSLPSDDVVKKPLELTSYERQQFDYLAHAIIDYKKIPVKEDMESYCLSQSIFETLGAGSSNSDPLPASEDMEDDLFLSMLKKREKAKGKRSASVENQSTPKGRAVNLPSRPAVSPPGPPSDTSASVPVSSSVPYNSPVQAVVDNAAELFPWWSAALKGPCVYSPSNSFDWVQRQVLASSHHHLQSFKPTSMA